MKQTQTQTKAINGFMVESCKSEDFKACAFWYVATKDEADKLAKDIKDMGNYAKITELLLRECALIGCHRLTEEIYCMRCEEIISDCRYDEINEGDRDI